MKTSNLSKKLAQYLSLAGSVIAGAANGQVVYTDLHDYHLNENSIYPIDLDGDSIVDITFGVNSFQTTSMNGQFNFATVKPGFNDTVVHASHLYPNPLSKSYMIGPAAYFVLNSSSQLAAWLSTGEGPGYQGLFIDWNEHYVGLKFHNASGTHYGWVRVKVNSRANSMEIYDYAYEKTPGRAILAGDTCGIPVAKITPNGPTTICNGDSVTLFCTTDPNYSYQWKNNGIDIPGATDTSLVVTQTGSYAVEIINNTKGCSKISTSQNVNVLPPAVIPQISLIGDTLVSTLALTYQWFLNGNIINGATSQIYTPVQNGDYTVEITDINNCPATSAIFILLNVGIDQAVINNDIELYPNPAKEVLSIKYKKEIKNPVKYKVYDDVGQLLLDGSFAKEEFQINISSLARGVYLLNLEDENEVVKYKFVKE